MLEKQDNQTQEMVEIPHDYLIEGVRKAVDDVDAFLAKARKQHGENYNWKNHYETFGRRFGYTDAEKMRDRRAFEELVKSIEEIKNSDRTFRKLWFKKEVCYA